MIPRLLNSVYPYLSIFVLEIGKFLEHANDILTGFVFILQAFIGIFTIVRLYRDIQNKKFKSIADEEKRIKRKYPFISALAEYLTKFKK